MSPTAKATIGIIIVVAVCTFLVLWQRRQSAEPPIVAVEPPTETLITPARATPARDDSAQVRAMQVQLAEEKRARQRAEGEAAALRQQLAPLQSNVVVLLGKVQDIGKRAGAFLPAMGELQALAGRDPSTLSADEKRRLLELQRDHARLLGALPEIAGFQNNPSEYGSFFSSMLQQAAGLTDAQAAQVEAYMRERAVIMNQIGLNAANEPTDPKLEEVWEERRDQFNEQTAHALKAILPPGAAEKAGLGPELMEFLEMDFDKLTPPAPAQKQQ